MYSHKIKSKNWFLTKQFRWTFFNFYISFSEISDVRKIHTQVTVIEW